MLIGWFQLAPPIYIKLLLKARLKISLPIVVITKLLDCFCKSCLPKTVAGQNTKVCKVTLLFQYANIAESKSAKRVPSPLAPLISKVR